MARPLNKILVIGAGSIGKRHHQNLLKLGVSANLVSYRAVAGGGLSALLDDGALSGVVIATATHVRTELIQLCAEREVPVYVEKPLGFQQADLYAVFSQAESIADRSMVGFMMRYHPFFKRLADADLSDVYRFEFTIGHDVTQWRADWRFADSYAALPEGGGVLLDLCHEVDMACCLFPDLVPSRVSCVGHADYPGVDFSSVVSFNGNTAAHGSVSMDYLSPVSTRKAVLYGRDRVINIDFNALEFSTDDGSQPVNDTIVFDRNDMFLDAMTDFLALTEHRPVSSMQHLPRLDLVRENCESIARAWSLREFTGKLSDPVK